jgi:DNA-3-methyladenine glycosylase II
MTDGLRSVRFDCDAACKTLRAADPRLALLMDRVGPFALRVKSTHSPFEALLEAIVYQQLHGKAAATILGRLLAIFPEGRPTPELLLKLPDEMLRGAGLSGSKTASIKDLAAKTVAGKVPTLTQIRRMDDAAIIERLTEIRGVGVWTVHMLLMFRLGRPDVLPIGDYGVRNGFALTFRRRKNGELVFPTPDELTRYAERWRPWRSVASWYMWRAVDLEKNKSTKD